MKAIKLILVLFSLSLIFTACDKNSRYSSMSVRMTDAPGDYDNVNVEIIGVQVHYSDANENNWVSIPTNQGIYDLLTLQNGVSTALTDEGKFKVGKINKMRLILGSNNSVVVDGVVSPLKTPSAENSGLKINMDVHFVADHKYEILLDFDADKSIVVEGNGSYSLKPVISVKSVIEL